MFGSLYISYSEPTTEEMNEQIRVLKNRNAHGMIK